MSAAGRPILGVDINPIEIRVVEMRGTWLNAQIVRAGAVPMPRGAMEGGRILYADAVAETLRGLLDRMKVGTRSAVLGIAPESVITRVLDIPRVAAHEVRMVIEGELAHYQIVREGTGVFDFMRLHESMTNLETNPQVLLMAAEERLLAGYRQVAEHAGLHLEAMEPLLLAMFRAAYPQAQALPSAVCVSVSHGKAEIAIVDHGQIRLYRRVDIGSDDLVAGRQEARPGARRHEPGTRERVLLTSEEEAPPEPVATPVTGGIVSPVANSLALELQRSLDYYRREYPQASAVTRAILSANDPEMEPLANWLSQALGIEMSVAEPPIAIGTSRAIASQLEAPEGLRFLGASGLAMRDLRLPPSTVPRFDLSVEERVEVGIENSRRRLGYAMIASIVLVALGILAALALGRNARIMAHQVEERRIRLGGVQRIEQARIDAIETQQNQERALKMEGFPIPRLMDGVANALDPQAGVSEMSLDPNGRLVVTGDASSERAIIRTLEGLKRCPYFVNTSLDSFDSTLLAGGRGRVVRFQISSQVAGLAPPETRATNAP